ncbi:hypothetical protein BT96DRAFT_1018413 [Gymnopus androsaceus JB14]|uniref:Uncharacterized protein n=1 Tax=Gymnopus androsaceus JB14 TaxID=1447944 RepID=A0A6A4HQ05_9AGAR|nr:hypothetical protein BT96DRAFT_1018413 [Gymnopus androsaceus JB14]
MICRPINSLLLALTSSGSCLFYTRWIFFLSDSRLPCSILSMECCTSPETRHLLCLPETSWLALYPSQHSPFLNLWQMKMSWWMNLLLSLLPWRAPRCHRWQGTALNPIRKMSDLQHTHTRVALKAHSTGFWQNKHPNLL